MIRHLIRYKRKWEKVIFICLSDDFIYFFVYFLLLTLPIEVI